MGLNATFDTATYNNSRLTEPESYLQNATWPAKTPGVEIKKEPH
jgi:hypothetical protein